MGQEVVDLTETGCCAETVAKPREILRNKELEKFAGFMHEMCDKYAQILKQGH